ncbi:hypothetical protein C8R44DRAFT_148732 [Mycena epipterygia]|nr:hypothetical protein C8R44DRAFT_148732 [Mycena epipterygia]
MEDNPRPPKRARTTPPADICSTKNAITLESQLRGPQLLLALPSLLLHPPTHAAHTRALAISLLALRRCLGVPNPGGHVSVGGSNRGQAGRKSVGKGAANAAWNLSPPDECRAWCALAEIGLCVLEGGFGTEGWAAGIEGEVERALGKALIIAQKTPDARVLHAASHPPLCPRSSTTSTSTSTTCTVDFREHHQWYHDILLHTPGVDGPSLAGAAVPYTRSAERPAQILIVCGQVRQAQRDAHKVHACDTRKRDCTRPRRPPRSAGPPFVRPTHQRRPARAGGRAARADCAGALGGGERCARERGGCGRSGFPCRRACKCRGPPAVHDLPVPCRPRRACARPWRCVVRVLSGATFPRFGRRERRGRSKHGDRGRLRASHDAVCVARRGGV